MAVPTETVYGLAGNGLDERAVQEIYEVKGRPAVKPLSLMVPDEAAMERYCDPVPEAARALARRFWPGPLTIVMRAREEVPALVRAGGETVGLRCPDHPLTLELLRQAGIPFAAPSANPSGEPSPKTARQVLDYFDGKIAAVVDGGPCQLQVESTLIDLSRKPYRILRQGALPRERIEDALADNLKIVGITGPTGSGKTTALHALRDVGALVLDCDAIYHELLTQDGELLSAIEGAFPGTVENGELQRKKLAALVFADPSALKELNRITHARVSAAVRQRLRDWAMAGGELAAIDAIELFGSGIDRICTLTVCVWAEEEKRLERIMGRDGIDREAALRRIRAQREPEYFMEKCSFSLENSGDEQEFLRKFQHKMEEYGLWMS